jgi:hypothetical protein
MNHEIIAAYEKALNSRNPDDVDIVDLLPAIFSAVSSATVEDVVRALREEGERQLSEAEQMRRRAVRS